MNDEQQTLFAALDAAFDSIPMWTKEDEQAYKEISRRREEVRSRGDDADIAREFLMDYLQSYDMKGPKDVIVGLFWVMASGELDETEATHFLSTLRKVAAMAPNQGETALVSESEGAASEEKEGRPVGCLPRTTSPAVVRVSSRVRLQDPRRSMSWESAPEGRSLAMAYSHSTRTLLVGFPGGQAKLYGDVTAEEWVELVEDLGAYNRLIRGQKPHCKYPS